MSSREKCSDQPRITPSLSHRALSASDVDVPTLKLRKQEYQNRIFNQNYRRYGEAELGEPRSAGSGKSTPALYRWSNLMLICSLIFGGCCANVFALEAIIKEQPKSGPLITIAQFLLTAAITITDFISPCTGLRSLYLRPRAIPLRSWLVYTAFFISVNLLNNWAFAYQISVPLHIILRSGGPVASMVIGYLFNAKRYSPGQILSVLMLTVGVVAAALADARFKGQSVHVEGIPATTTITGFAILAVAMVLSAFQGIYADRLYETYGRDHWKEALFYSHILSLPLFLPTYPHVATEWRALFSSHTADRPVISVDSETSKQYCNLPCLASIASKITELLSFHLEYRPWRLILSATPKRLIYLAVNALTQYLCIRGVHLLSAKTSSLTVTIVLNVRKLVSLLLSIYIFGNSLTPGVFVGALLVFLGGAFYGYEGTRAKKTHSDKR
ncbi:putative UPD-GlcNAc transporter (Mnn2-2) [Aspergillus saccharolyticus JOP 1030-1]|uniref:UAA transporter n=1 Tax=Aspergillus saccharolyticus JOP 1030-1 TaxID=1450539 RepID=A0A318ZXC7_9EURO|nr:UAA transporter [Aspergillus saccharolyticus JOP 1030-1]PYH44798.1 UAA transporter [Aspergillus saccharolyticus JOP 1030-1]